MVSVLSQINPVHIFPHCFSKILLNVTLPSTHTFWNALFRLVFPTTILSAFLTSFMSATCPAHLILLDIITLIIFGEKCNFSSSSLCSFLQPPPTSFLLGPSIFLSTLFSNTLNLCCFLRVTDQVSHPYITTIYIIVLFNNASKYFHNTCPFINARSQFVCNL